MKVCLQIQFRSPTTEDESCLRRLALRLTDDPDSVCVAAREDKPDWLVAEFTMPTEAQYKAVDKIDGKLRFSDVDRIDSIISFPKTEPKSRRPRGTPRQ